MPKKVRQLTVRDGKILAYDDQQKKFFLVRLEPIDLEVLEKDEVLEVVKMALCHDTPDVVI